MVSTVVHSRLVRTSEILLGDSRALVNPYLHSNPAQPTHGHVHVLLWVSVFSP